MSRSGYTDGADSGASNLWAGNLERAIRGRRGQAFLRDMVAALDAMPVRELVAEEVVRDADHVCGLGSVAVARNVDVSDVDPEDTDEIAERLGIARHLAREVAYQNDEEGRADETPAQRWTRMREWVRSKIVEVPA